MRSNTFKLAVGVCVTTALVGIGWASNFTKRRFARARASWASVEVTPAPRALGSSGPLQPDLVSGSGTWAILPNRGSLFKTRRPPAASGRCLQQKEMAHIGKMPFSPLTWGCPLFSCLTLCSTRAASASAGSAVRRGRGHARPLLLASFHHLLFNCGSALRSLCSHPLPSPRGPSCKFWVPGKATSLPFLEQFRLAGVRSRVGLSQGAAKSDGLAWLRELNETCLQKQFKLWTGRVLCRKLLEMENPLLPLAWKDFKFVRKAGKYYYVSGNGWQEEIKFRDSSGKKVWHLYGFMQRKLFDVLALFENLWNCIFNYLSRAPRVWKCIILCFIGWNLNK